MPKNHFPQHCTCSDEPLKCECGCRSCAQKKGRARDAEVKAEVQQRAQEEPDYRDMLMEYKRDNTMEMQFKSIRAFGANDYFKQPARQRAKHWAQGIGAPAYATLDNLISNN